MLQKHFFKRMLLIGMSLLVSFFALPGQTEESPDVEIEYLLVTVGQSNCSFIRNGISHSAENAESHLRLKYSRGSKYVSNADEFIDRLASESSWTGKDYMIECPETGKQPSAEWLNQRLSEYRAQSSD